MSYHSPLKTEKKEAFQPGQGSEAQKYGCYPSLKKDNMPKIGRM